MEKSESESEIVKNDCSTNTNEVFSQKSESVDTNDSSTNTDENSSFSDITLNVFGNNRLSERRIFHEWL